MNSAGRERGKRKEVKVEGRRKNMDRKRRGKKDGKEGSKDRKGGKEHLLEYTSEV